MDIGAGTQLGSYQVVAQLGAGGMGVVYQAHDTKLGRDVAIKVLPEAFAFDPERLSRFQREAKMLASLNHPNIAQIYGLEQSDGFHFLIMELVPGETLAQKVKGGPLPLEDALKICAQIAEALEAAHEKSIIHRDLKPANVKVTPEGKVKVLDFGLAKAFAGDAETANISDSPTLSRAATMQGVILGTAAYMSPEQARGLAVNKATDIWALGCVLYELLTGHPAFAGEDITEILAAVVKTEPDWGRLPEDMQQTIRELLRRCLRKRRHERFHDAADVRIEIEEALASPQPVTTVNTAPPRTFRRWALISGLACLVAAGVAGLAVWRLTRNEQPPETARVLVSSAPADQFSPPRPTRTALALSPDGKSLVFSATKGGKQQLYLRALDRLEATPMPGTESGNSPFFSPDGHWLGFWQGTAVVGTIGDLKIVPLNGGPAVTICKTGPLYGASWGPNDAVVFANQVDGGLWRVPAGGGNPQPLTTVDTKDGEFGHRLPQLLPGGQAVLYTIVKTRYRWDDAQIAVRSLVTNEQKVLIKNAADARYVPTGHLVYLREGTLMAVPFDLARLETTGSPVGLIENVLQDENSTSVSGDTGAGQFSLSESGSLVYLPGGIVPDREESLFWVDRNGKAEEIPVSPRPFYAPRLSPDEQQLTFSTLGIMNQSVWTYGTSRGGLSRLTTEGQNLMAIWTPDGKRVTFSSGTAGPQNLFWKPADGSGPAERLTTSEHVQRASSWSPDGRTLAFLEILSDVNIDIWTLSFENGAVKTRPFLQSPSLKRWAEFSPDGRWLAYGSNESGRDEVYVQPFPGPGGRQQVSTEGGREPAWAHNGREMYYLAPGLNGALKMMAVDVALQPTFTAGKPRVLFEGRFNSAAYIRNYDVTLDGRRFVLCQTKEQPPAPPLTEMVLVQNWFEELKQKVPAGKK